ncbi:MAG: HEPN domain-containing protein [Calditrichaeota bacterium]|nr:HEPN domain-containing protein [Spirochaetales bacterium]RQW04873.1 MAG: HEPN domain-containing protein [Calditrichota bacterium]
MKPHEEWLFKAENDLESAKVLLESKKQLFDIIVYHSQQCAEKSLKGFLAFHNRKIEKIHNLVVLIKKCEEINADFEKIREQVIFLNPFSTIYRYPDNELLPSLTDTHSSITKAEEILVFVKKLVVS